MKRIFSMVVVAAMMLAMAMPTFAKSPQSIANCQENIAKQD